MRGAILLLEAELLDRSRRGFLLPPHRGRQPRVAQAALLSLALPLLILLVAYLLPLLVAPHLVPFSDRPSARVPALTINLACTAVLFLGLFVGAYLVYEQTLAENRLVLAYPITIRELALYRLVHAALAALKAIFYLALPVLLGQLLLRGFPAGRTLLIVVITGLVLIALFLGAVSIMLLLCGVLPGVGPDRLFIGLFLASAWAVVVALQIRTGFLAELLASLGQLAALGSLPAVLVRILGATPISASEVGLVLSLPLLASLLLLVLLAGALEDAYIRLHRRGLPARSQPHQNGLPVSGEPSPRSGYSRLDRVFRSMPAPVRALVIKDILSFWRRPHALLRVAAAIVVMVVGCRVGLSTVNGPELGVLYLLPAFIVFRLFIDSVGIEACNSHLLRLSFSGAGAYLRTRAFIAAAVGLSATLVTWLIVTPWLETTGIQSVLTRGVLLGLSSVLGAAFVTAFSAFFSAPHSTGFSQYEYSVRPVALAFSWGIGPLVPLLFFLIDSGLIAQGTASSWTLVATIGLAVIALATTVLWRLASRSLFRNMEKARL